MEYSGKRFILSGLCLGVSDLMRPEGSILLIAMVCCAGMSFLQSPSKRRGRELLLSIVLVLIGYMLVKKGTELALAGILPNGISNSVPEWKFVLGLDFTGRGTYSDKNLYVLDIGDASARRAATLDIIRNSWADCDHRLDFFLVYLLIEVQPRYRCELMPLLAIMSAAGFTKLKRREKE